MRIFLINKGQPCSLTTVTDKLNYMTAYDARTERFSHKNKNTRAIQHAVPG
jgi:hypothetical protein